MPNIVGDAARSEAPDESLLAGGDALRELGLAESRVSGETERLGLGAERDDGVGRRCGAGFAADVRARARRTTGFVAAGARRTGAFATACGGLRHDLLDARDADVGGLLDRGDDRDVLRVGGEPRRLLLRAAFALAVAFLAFGSLRLLLRVGPSLLRVGLGPFDRLLAVALLAFAASFLARSLALSAAFFAASLAFASCFLLSFSTSLAAPSSLFAAVPTAFLTDGDCFFFDATVLLLSSRTAWFGGRDPIAPK